MALKLLSAGGEKPESAESNADELGEPEGSEDERELMAAGGNKTDELGGDKLLLIAAGGDKMDELGGDERVLIAIKF